MKNGVHNTSQHAGASRDNPTYSLRMSNPIRSQKGSFRTQLKLPNFFIVIGFLIMTGWGVQIIEILRGENTIAITGSLVNQIIYLSLYVITIVFLTLSRRIMPLGIIRNFWFWLLLAWTFLSVFWSGVPTVTFRNVMALFGTSLFAFYVVNTLDIQEYLALLAISFFILNISSYLCIIFFPSIGIEPIGSGEWRGVFLYKNILALMADLSILIFSYLILVNKKGKWVWLIGLLSSIGLVIGSRSAGGIIISVFTILLIMTFYLTHKSPILFWILFFEVLIVISIFSYSLPSVSQILDYFNKDATLTGRTLLWEFSINMGLRKPLLGYGYGGFWLGSEGPSALMPMEVLGNILSAHNGFIEIFLTLGGIGLFIFLFMCLTAIQRSALLLLKKQFEFKYSIYLMIIIFILAYNFTENTFLLRNNILWVIFSSMIFYQSNKKMFI